MCCCQSKGILQKKLNAMMEGQFIFSHSLYIKILTDDYIHARHQNTKKSSKALDFGS